MHAIRSTALVALSALALAVAACSSSPADTSASAETSESALVVDNAEAPASSTVSSATCTSIDDLVEANAEALRGLCAKGQVPVPQDVTDDGCEEGSATSVTFKCVAAKHHPKPPKDGCQEFDIKDDHQAIPEKGGKHVHRLPPVLCPIMGHAAPPKGEKGCEGGPGGGRAGGPNGDGGAPPPPPPGDGGAPPPPPPGDGGPVGPGAGGPPPPSPGGPAGDGGPKPPGAHKKGPPKIRCCAPPPPKGGPGGGPGAPPPPGGPKGPGGETPPAPPASSGSDSASSTPT